MLSNYGIDAQFHTFTDMRLQVGMLQSEISLHSPLMSCEFEFEN